jgi:hypothetical protein
VYRIYYSDALLAAALKEARASRCRLLISRLDRLSRNVTSSPASWSKRHRPSASTDRARIALGTANFGFYLPAAINCLICFTAKVTFASVNNLPMSSVALV